MAAAKKKSGILDLDAVAAPEGREPFPFVFGGEQFELSADPDVATWEHLAKGNIQTALLMALGGEQYQKLDELDAVLTSARMEALLEAYSKHLGIEPGKSGGRSASSGSTLAR